MKLAAVIILFAAFIILTLYLGRDIPANEYEGPAITSRGIMRASDSVLITIRLYGDGSTMLCTYLVDPRHRQEAQEFLTLEMVESTLDDQLRANMELRRRHVREELGCKWCK